MIKVVSVATTRQIEKTANDTGLTYDVMMQNAGRAVATRVLNKLRAHPSQEQVRVTILVGPGNNGGDGLVAARLIAQESSAQVRCYLLKRRDENDPNLKAARDAGLFIANAEDDQRYRVLYNMVASAHIIVDALFGIGVRLPLEGEAEKLLRQVQAALKEAPERDLETAMFTPTEPEPSLPRAAPYVVAVDCPSGLDADTGALDKNALHADETVTFIAAKPGLFLFPGAEAVGKLTIAQIGIPEDTAPLKAETWMVADADTVREWLPKREAGAHKGTFGKAMIVGGSVNYSGAPALSAEGAYRVGAGLVTVAAPPQIVPIVGSHLTEATYIILPNDLGVISAPAAEVVREDAAKYNALLVGPGLGREKTTGEMLAALLDPTGKKAGRHRAIGFGITREAQAIEAENNTKLPPLVIDADGLYHLSQMERWWTLLPENTVITPHPGEMSQLTGMATAEIQADRWKIAANKAREWNVVLVLKGAHTLIAEPGGRVVVLPFKTTALATAGTGDVLAGMIAGFLAQGMAAFEAAVVAGYVHGLAGQQMEFQVGAYGTTASDIAHYGVPQALRLLSNP